MTKKRITMKKLNLLLLALAASFTLQAQWVDDPIQNTFIANSSSDAGEIYLSTDAVSGDTYMQFNQMRSNGWVPTIQRLNFEGVPQWGNDGITITGQTFSTWSQGVAMVATNDGGVVSCFSNEAGHCVAVKINADGTFPWGEQGITLFEGQGGSRTELLAGDDGGVWALGADYETTFLCHIKADGTTYPTITISDPAKDCMFGLMVPGPYNTVFVVYEKESWAYTYYYEKELWVIGFSPEGGQIAPEVQLMTPYTMVGSYAHHVVPDGLNGGYAYMWHAGIGGAFNTYVFHFDEYGNSTINDLNGVAVHSTDPLNYYLDAYATVDPISHDLIIAYQKTDDATQSQNRIYMNRITATGETVWGEGILVADYTGADYSEIKVDAFEDGSGFSIIYKEDELVQAKGYDMDGNLLWSNPLSTTSYNKTFCENSTGFHLGQNIVAWVNSANGGVYGQNIGPDGTMGPIEPPVNTCLAPENFMGMYLYNDETQTFGALLKWDAPETQPLHYNLYVTTPDGCTTTIEIEPTETEYFDETTVVGTIIYQLTAVYEDCESEFALTPEGENIVKVEVTGIAEDTEDAIVTIVRIYNANGQCLRTTTLDDLNTGIYIIQGLTRDGQMVNKKVVVNK